MPGSVDAAGSGPMTRSAAGSVGEGAASRRRRPHRHGRRRRPHRHGRRGLLRFLPLPLGGLRVLLLVLVMLKGPAAAAAGARDALAGFVRPTTQAASCVWRRGATTGIAPPRRGAVVVWGQQQRQGEQGNYMQQEQEGQRWQRRRGQAAALLEAPQRYGSQDWIENLKSLLVSRIAKRISGHLIFNTGGWVRATDFDPLT